MNETKTSLPKMKGIPTNFIAKKEVQTSQGYFYENLFDGVYVVFIDFLGYLLTCIVLNFGNF